MGLGSGAARRVGAVAIVVSFVLPGQPAPTLAADPPPVPPVEEGDIPELRTATSRTVDNGDGTRTAHLFPGPVNFRDEVGAWQPISNRIVANSDTGFAWRNEGNSFAARFAETAGETVVEIATGRASVGLRLQGATSSIGVVEGSAITYPEVSPGVALEYEVVNAGVKETLILSNASVASEYDFTLRGDRPLMATETGDGGWRVSESWSGDWLFDLAAPTVVDAAGAVGPAELSVSAVASGGLVATLSVDPGWLTESGRAFPVALDPTFVVWEPVQDAYFDIDDSFGAQQRTSRLNVGSTSSSTTYRSALKFDLGALPATAAITDADAYVYFDGTCVGSDIAIGAGAPDTCGLEDHVVDLHAITSTWTSTTRWPQMSFETTRRDSETIAVADFLSEKWLVWDVTGLAADWFTGTRPNDGFLLKRRTEPDGSNGPAFISSRHTDAAHWPALAVTYEETVLLDDPPQLVRSNGATLSWSRYEGWSGRTFNRYEVTRDGQLLASITDRDVTTFTDTTAGDSKPYTYTVTVVSDGTVRATSQPLRLTTTATGKAILNSRPDGVSGKMTELRSPLDGAVLCADYGTQPTVRVGRDDTQQQQAHYNGKPSPETVKTTQFDYLGTTPLTINQTEYDSLDPADGAAPDRTLAFGYDGAGTRISAAITDPSGNVDTHSYSYDVHGSVTQLIDETGAIDATYGYTAYGNTDDTLTAGDTDPVNPINPFRYSAHRHDTASGSIDMGARRFAPDITRFLQADRYLGAIPNLNLSLDPLTGNRYALAAGNPISFIEVTGREPRINGYGRSYFEAGHTMSLDPTPTEEDDERIDVRHVPPAASELDQVWIRFFIEAEQSCDPLYLVCVEGDNRTASDDTDDSARVTVKISPKSGTAELLASGSCGRQVFRPTCEKSTTFSERGGGRYWEHQVSISSASGGYHVSYSMINSVTKYLGFVGVEGGIYLKDLASERPNVVLDPKSDMYPSIEVLGLQGGKVTHYQLLQEETGVLRGAAPPFKWFGNAWESLWD